MTVIANPDRYKEMLYRRCGDSGLLLPAVSLGLWHNFGGVDTYENARAMILRAFDLGITHFDLANDYGPPPGSAGLYRRAAPAGRSDRKYPPSRCRRYPRCQPAVPPGSAR